MGWIRIDKSDGAQETEDEARVLRVTAGFYKDVELTLEAAKNGADIETPFATYRWSE